MTIQAVGNLAGFSIPADGTVASYRHLWGDSTSEATWLGGVFSLPLVSGNTALFNSFPMSGDFRHLAVHNRAIEELNLTDTDELQLFFDLGAWDCFSHRTSPGEY